MDSHWILSFCTSSAEWKNLRPAVTTQGEEEEDVDQGFITVFLQPCLSLQPHIHQGCQQGQFFPLVDLVLKDVEVVSGRYSDYVLMWMPCCVKDLLAEVQAVYTDLILSTLPTHTHLARLENGSGFAVFSGCFQRDVTFSVPVKHSEEVVIGAGHYDAV